MSLLGSKEDSCLVELVLAPEGEDNPDPHIAQGAHCHTVRFAFLSLASVIGLSPRLLERTLPSELVERITQRFDTRPPLVDRGMLAALKGHW